MAYIVSPIIRALQRISNIDIPGEPMQTPDFGSYPPKRITSGFGQWQLLHPGLLRKAYILAQITLGGKLCPKYTPYSFS
jgi:hypothetical protein